jgi:hypothetical protein
LITLLLGLPDKDHAIVQGFDASDLADWKFDQIDEALLRDCVGNAFSCPVAVLAIVAALCDM